ncbi:hypothetical protein [Oenococcus sp.]|uniref:hypothetical protein n=1 Tax=Oenococcus sp. TaxID=1979414 RepID=UPI0039ED7A08
MADNLNPQTYSKVTISGESVLIDGHKIEGLNSYKINSFEKSVSSYWLDQDDKKIKKPNIVRLEISILVSDLNINK